MDIWLLIAIIINAILLICLIGLLIIYRLAFFNEFKKKNQHYDFLKGKTYDKFHPEMKKLTDEILALPFEEVNIQSHDKINLYARVYPSKLDNAPVYILAHGYKGDSIRDNMGFAKYAIEHHCHAILIDHRGHHNSSGRTITFGVKERYDVIDWINYAKQRFGENVRIVLVGISMGAATVLMCSNLDIKPNVKGIIADCPYSSPREIIKEVMKQMHLNANFFIPFVKLAGLIFAHFNIDTASPIEAIKEAQVPILIIHGTGDKFVPVEMSKEMKEKNPSINLVLVDEASHGMSWFYDNEKYLNAVNEFLNKIDCIE